MLGNKIGAVWINVFRDMIPPGTIQSDFNERRSCFDKIVTQRIIPKDWRLDIHLRKRIKRGIDFTQKTFAGPSVVKLNPVLKVNPNSVFTKLRGQATRIEVDWEPKPKSKKKPWPFFAFPVGRRWKRSIHSSIRIDVYDKRVIPTPTAFCIVNI